MGKNNKPKQQSAELFAEGDVVKEPYVPASEPSEPETVIPAEKIPTATPVEPENEPVGGEPKTIQEAPAEPKKDSEQELIDELTSILRVPKSKDALMTFSMFSDKYQKRYFLLDVDGTAYRRAWEVFKERTGSKDQNRFLFLVYTILEMNPPRLHRGVDWVPLE